MHKKNKKDNNFLKYIPIKSDNKWRIKDNGKVIIYFEHDKLIEKFLYWLVQKPTTTDLELDDIGTEVWLLIDNNKTIYDIGVIIKDKFGDKIEPLYERLIIYFRILKQKKLVSFII